MSSEFVTERIVEVFSADLAFPDGLSFFGPYLQYFLKEILETGGEAYVSRGSDGAPSGLFIYDNAEKTGTIFTRSREVFDSFYELKPFNFLFSELGTEHESEAYDIYTIDLDDRPIVHRFGHEISMAQERHVDELARFMLATHPGMNGKWVKVALRNGERCFIVRLGDEIAGVGWASLVKGIGRLHSLYVRPQFRGMGMGEDILYARLLWLKSKHAHSAFSEISRHNHPSSRVAAKGYMTASGQMFQYFKKKDARVPGKDMSS
jgi:ribosomal protein S18 acetylase RimI-like enzyme